jgi:hypothetical protein
MPMRRPLCPRETLANCVRRRLFENGYVSVNPTGWKQTPADGRTLPSASALIG